MEIYLVIITTILVLTQIIRVTQNYIQLKHLKKTDEYNESIRDEWFEMLNALENLNENLLQWRDKN